MSINRQPRYEADFFNLLIAATLESSLQSLLAFDTTESELMRLANQFAWIIARTNGALTPIKVLTLNSATTEEKLWGHFGIKPDSRSITWKPSLLVQHEERDPLLVVIPNLTRLSLPATRACVTLLDSECVTLQRDGIDLTWQPDFWCIAGCPRDRIGEISPHLLDRFALRGRPPNYSIRSLPAIPLSERFQLLDNDLTGVDVELPEIASKLAARGREILTANEAIPSMSLEASDRVLAYFREKCPSGMRRLLTLARLARALSRLAGEKIISVDHVDRAAQLLGMAQILPVTTVKPSDPQKPVKSPSRQPDDPFKSLPAKDESNKEVQTEQVVRPDMSQTFPDAVVSEPYQPDELNNPYPEDDSIVARDMDSLKLPMVRSRSPRAGYGHPIGTQPATTLEDISLYGTVLEAAKFQNYRNLRFNDEPHRFRIWLSDLRSYRRIPVPQYMLLCALDFTCLNEDLQWLKALEPHFRDWAYVNRASIGIVRIGAKEASHPLRAELVQARNLLSDQVVKKALTGQSGIATPLAHGLDLAGRLARAALQHGRSRVDCVRLVVVTDGRGNIPLQASLEGKLDHPVSQEGIDDALAMAKMLSEIPRLEIVLLDPQPQFYAELPQMLAKELGAVIEKVAIKRAQPVQESDVSEMLEPISLEEVAL